MKATDSSEYKQIGLRIREIRTGKKMSQQELAAAADISLPHISEIELGKSRMQAGTLKRIAEALQVSTDFLLRPNVPEVNAIYQAEFHELLSDCTPSEIDSIFKIVREVKATMRAHSGKDTE